MQSLIVAHRGNAAQYRENSTAAIRSALQLGCKYVEVDVQISADGVPMLAHDNGLMRVFHRAANVTETHSRVLMSYGMEPLFKAVKLCEAHRATLFVEIKRESYDKFGDSAVSAAVDLRSETLRPH